MKNETKQTAVDILINTFKENIRFLESNLEDVTDPTTKIQLIARLSQARYFLNYAIEAKEMEKERELNAYANGQADTLLMFKQKISKMKDIPTEFNQIISENFWDLV